MKNKKVFMVSLIIMIIAIIFMGINWFISPMSDNAIRLTGLITLIDIFVLTYNTIKLKNNGN